MFISEDCISNPKLKMHKCFKKSTVISTKAYTVEKEVSLAIRNGNGKKIGRQISEIIRIFFHVNTICFHPRDGNGKETRRRISGIVSM